MKIVSYLNNLQEERGGLWVNERVFELPFNVMTLLQGGEKLMDEAREIEARAKTGRAGEGLARASVKLLAPVPKPVSCRDAYAFRQHVAAARKNRGMEMIPEFDQFPIFYYTNHTAIVGEGDVTVEKDHLEQLDFELEAAIVIGKHGKNVSSNKADSYIAGFTIMNDLSARTLQMEEMKLSLGPAKGKDFATVLGPWLVTPDELESVRSGTEFGSLWNLKMTARHNGKQVSAGNLKDMNWTFAEIIERVSYGVDIYPGEVIGSGTVGTGCYMELNGTWALNAKEKGEKFSPVWLKDGDTIELEIERLGVLTNRIRKNPSEHSILAKKKNV